MRRTPMKGLATPVELVLALTGALAALPAAAPPVRAGTMPHAAATMLPRAAPSAPPPSATGSPGFAARFRAANTPHDGRLTLGQAQRGGLRGVAQHFAEIDRGGLGYVTLAGIRRWSRARAAASLTRR